MNRYRKTLCQVEEYDGHTPALAAGVLLRTMAEDEWVADMVETVLRGDTSQRERAEAMCRLLGTFGVGSIVEGRLV